MFVPYRVLFFAANILFQFHDVATGLKSLHDRGVIHGDIRPVCERFRVLCRSSDLLFFII